MKVLGGLAFVPPSKVKPEVYSSKTHQVFVILFVFLVVHFKKQSISQPHSLTFGLVHGALCNRPLVICGQKWAAL